MRILHISDIHLEDGFLHVPKRAFLSKRLIGWGNLALRRRAFYRDAPEKLQALARLATREQVDAILLSGDLTALGTPVEHRYARAQLQRFAPFPLILVPGNHDIYLEDAIASFDEVFGELLTSDLPELCVDGPYPFVRLLSPEVAVVGVNSARPNPEILSSAGRVPTAQLAALETIFARPELQTRFTFVMTHYAPRAPHGGPDHARHGLENADALLRVCEKLPRGALCHGHIHHCFRLTSEAIPLFGAGSTTMRSREGLWLFEIDAAEAFATRGRFHEGEYILEASSRAAVGSLPASQ